MLKLATEYFKLTDTWADKHAEDILHRQPSKGKEVSPEMSMDREFQKKVKDMEAEIGKLWKRRDALPHSYWKPTRLYEWPELGVIGNYPPASGLRS